MQNLPVISLVHVSPMPKALSLEDTLAALRQARADPTAATSLPTLRAALASRSPHAAAKAANIVGEHLLEKLIPDLIVAFDRCMKDPVKTDPGCVAKAAIADALYRLGADTPDIFYRGIRHIQREPSFGPPLDSATALRSACGFGLVRIAAPDALTELAMLMADAEPNVRQQAAEAIAYADNPAGLPLLRFKVLIGDDEPAVLTECFTALLKIEPTASLPFVATFLDGRPDETAEAAALSLGASRQRDAFPLLRTWWDRSRDEDLRRTALLAIAMLKLDETFAFLLSLVAEAPGMSARDAVAALAIFRHDDALRVRVATAAAQRTDRALHGVIDAAFERP